MITEKIIPFPRAAVEERGHGFCSERVERELTLGGAIRAYKRALEVADLTNREQVEKGIKPLYEIMLARAEESGINIVYIREECVFMFKYEHERQQSLKALGKVILIDGLEKHMCAEDSDPHNQPPAKRAA